MDDLNNYDDYLDCYFEYASINEIKQSWLKMYGMLTEIVVDDLTKQDIEKIKATLKKVDVVMTGINKEICEVYESVE